MPRVDGIGVSSAGVFIGNSPMVSALFLKVPREKRELVKTIYDRAAREIGDVPIVVANDGDPKWQTERKVFENHGKSQSGISDIWIKMSFFDERLDTIPIQT